MSTESLLDDFPAEPDRPPVPVPYERTAVLSACRQYRYELTRRWARGILLPIVMLNPSTADAEVDDPTIRRCMGFAAREEFAGILVVNLYAYRATDPKQLWTVEDPVGPENNAVLLRAFDNAADLEIPVLLAWGANARADRIGDVVELMPDELRVCCLGMTTAGQPRHPLMLAADTPLAPWSPR